ncbi:MAG: haloacid dehalogenase type II [Alphaproteobacteria bacterium]|nr:haloacid dehalogenase type II [Alphaproteobacteria bacterium]
MDCLRKAKLLVFDAYGTLFDVAAAVRRMAPFLKGKDSELALLWRQKQLEYTWQRSLRADFADFEQVTAQALGWALESLELDSGELKAPLMALYRELDAYPDARQTLEKLKQTGRKTAILSNGSKAMLAAAVTSAGIGPYLDAVLSVDPLRIYKPHPSVYALVGAHFAVTPEQVAFVSGNYWDASAGAANGFSAIWINRTKALPEPLPGQIKAVIQQLSELPGLLA